jgi:hypothetical protein
MQDKHINRLIALAEELAEIAQDDGRICESIRTSIKRLRTNEFNLVLLGQFKGGKSTLANCFLGKEALPSGVLAKTGFGSKKGLE